MATFIELRNNYDTERDEYLGRRSKSDPHLAVLIHNGAVRDTLLCASADEAKLAWGVPSAAVHKINN